MFNKKKKNRINEEKELYLMLFVCFIFFCLVFYVSDLC